MLLLLLWRKSFTFRAEITLLSNITFYTSISYTDQLNIHWDVDSCPSSTETEARHEIREPSWPFQTCFYSSWSLHQTPLEKLTDLHLSLYLGILPTNGPEAEEEVFSSQTDRHWLLLVRMWPKFNMMIKSNCSVCGGVSAMLYSRVQWLTTKSQEW